MMASFLRQIVAGPRSRHAESNLDLCYVTDNIVATSGPSATYPSLAYRNPLSDLVAFLDSAHGDQWCLFEFRAEGCGYPDESVYGRIWHWPWPDHHPPPFALVPKIMGSMRAWLNPEEPERTKDAKNERVAVVHCKAGKGRSGSMAVSYMITHLGWNKNEALQRFTEQRMRPNFGPGISIPSQRRWIDYVERWASHGQRIYVERRIEVKEVHIWGLKDGVRVSIEGFVDSGKQIKEFHVFTGKEREINERLTLPASSSGSATRPGLTDVVTDVLKKQKTKLYRKSTSQSPVERKEPSNSSSAASSMRDFKENGSTTKDTTYLSSGGIDVIYRPSNPIILPTSDVNLAVERRTSGSYGFPTLTSVAHVWFNCYFEGSGPENYQKATEGRSLGENDSEDLHSSLWADPSGVFTIDWDAMDGIKGSSRKGMRSFDKVDIVWAAVGPHPVNESTESPHQNPVSTSGQDSLIVVEPALGEQITPVEAADWQGLLGNGKESQDPAEARSPSKALIQNEESIELSQTSDIEEDGAEGLRHGLPVESAGSAGSQ